MIQYNTLNVILPHSQLNKLKCGIKNGTEVILKLSSNVVGDSNDENNFPPELLLTNTQVLKFRKAFENGSSANIKLSKSQLHKIGQSGAFSGRLLGPLLKTRLTLVGNILKPSHKSVLIPLGLTAATSATDSAIHKKIFGSGVTTLIISKIISCLEESGLLINDVSQTIKNEAKKQKRGFLSMLLGTLRC